MVMFSLSLLIEILRSRRCCLFVGLDDQAKVIGPSLHRELATNRHTVSPLDLGPSGLSGERRGFPARAGLVDRGLAGIAGLRREPAGTSCGISAGCIVARVVNHPEVCGTRCCSRQIGRSTFHGGFALSFRSTRRGYYQDRVVPFRTLDGGAHWQ